MNNEYVRVLFVELAYNDSKLVGLSLFDKLMWSKFNGIEIL